MVKFSSNLHSRNKLNISSGTCQVVRALMFSIFFLVASLMFSMLVSLLSGLPRCVTPPFVLLFCVFLFDMLNALFVWIVESDSYPQPAKDSSRNKDKEKKRSLVGQQNSRSDRYDFSLVWRSYFSQNECFLFLVPELHQHLRLAFRTMELVQLQNLCKRDPASYKDEFMLQYKHFQTELQIFQLKPAKDSEMFRSLITFVSHVCNSSFVVGGCYSC